MLNSERSEVREGMSNPFGGEIFMDVKEAISAAGELFGS